MRTFTVYEEEIASMPYAGAGLPFLLERKAKEAGISYEITGSILPVFSFSEPVEIWFNPSEGSYVVEALA
jgi:hypothetical protein